MSTLLETRTYEKRTVDVQHERAKRATQVLSSFATGLCLRSVKVSLVKGSGAPAFSSASEIWLDEDQLADLTTTAGVASLKGLTLHEIAHLLLTPRMGSDLREWVVENNLHPAFNALEDQRIETLLSAQFPPIKDWLSYTIAQYLLKSEGIDRAFPLIRGRKYLTAEVRRAVRDAYIDQHNVQELSDIIDAYRLLNLARIADCEIAKPLIERYNELVSSLPPVGGGTDANGDEQEIGEGGWASVPDPNGHGERSQHEHPTSVSSQPMKPKQQDKAVERAKSEPVVDEADLPPTNSDKSDKPDNSADSGNSAGSQDAEQVARDLLEDLVEQTLEALADQIDNDISVYSGQVLLEGEAVPAPNKPTVHKDLSIDADIVHASDQFGYELERLRADFRPAWVRRVSHGRVNGLRWERGCEIDEAFDRFKSGEASATDIECVILLDASGSMDSEAERAYKSMWAIKNALDSVDASTTVVVYGSRSYTLYEANEPAGGTAKYAGTLGGTTPLRGVQYAKSVLANSKRAIKLFINITDGEWEDAEACDNAIRDIREGGVLTALGYVQTSRWHTPEFNNHGCEIGVSLTNASDLFRLGQHLVEVGIQRNLTR
jgi:hypothetical protein